MPPWKKRRSIWVEKMYEERRPHQPDTGELARVAEAHRSVPAARSGAMHRPSPPGHEASQAELFFSHVVHTFFSVRLIILQILSQSDS